MGSVTGLQRELATVRCGLRDEQEHDDVQRSVLVVAADGGDLIPVLITPLLLLLDPRLDDLDLHRLEEAARLDGLPIVEIHSALNADLVAQPAHHPAGGSEGPFSVDGCVVDVAAEAVDQGDYLVILVLPPVLPPILLLFVLLDPQLLDLHHTEDVPQAGAACGSGCTAGRQSMPAEVVPADGRLRHEAKHGHWYVSAAARVKQGLVSPPASSCAAALFPRAWVQKAGRELPCLARRSWRWVSRLRPASSVADRLRYGTAATRTGLPVPTQGVQAPLPGHARCCAMHDGGRSRSKSARTQALDDSWRDGRAFVPLTLDTALSERLRRELRLRDMVGGRCCARQSATVRRSVAAVEFEC